MLNLPDSGETTLPPAQCIAAGGGSLSTGNFRLVYFTAAKTESITKISTYAATAAAATPTLCRVGTIGNTAIRQFFWLKP